VNDSYKTRFICSTPDCCKHTVDAINEMIVNQKVPEKVPIDDVIALIHTHPSNVHKDPQEQERIVNNRRCRFLLLTQCCLHSYGRTIGGLSKTTGAPRELMVTAIGTNIENSKFAFPKAHSPRAKTLIGLPNCSGCIDPQCRAIWPIDTEKANDIKCQLGFLTNSDLADFEARIGLRIEQAVSSAVTSQALSLLRDTFKETRDGLLAASVLNNASASSQQSQESQVPANVARTASETAFRPAPAKDEEMEDKGKDKRQNQEGGEVTEPPTKRLATDTAE
jgi:hypothetical protein